MIVEEGWSVDDVKSMEDISSHIYTKAVNAGLPNGIIRKLKGELSMFKKQWREVYEPARTLKQIGGQQGGQQEGQQEGGF